MITLVLTYRNRDLCIVKNCLNSLDFQSSKDFNVILVDYGSEAVFANPLQELVSNYSFITLITCPVQGQLWNKARAINIALKQTKNPFFIVGDIDLIFHPNFIEKALKLNSQEQSIYFKVGFLNEVESKKNSAFEEYKVKHYSSEEATGITLFYTNTLKEINGYDEFYNSWGAEDTDVHLRLRNQNKKVVLEEEILLLHQWHPKAYRSKASTSPFHTKLEKINHFYLQITNATKRTIANINFEWGKMPLEEDYSKLKNIPDYFIKIDATDNKVASVLAQLNNFKSELVSIHINEIPKKIMCKNYLKKIVGKKHHSYFDMEAINILFLEEIIKNYRNLPYHFSFDREKNEIKILIQF
ncbi:Galactosyltransferase, C-terminal [Flavobacteriaceae bacterium]